MIENVRASAPAGEEACVKFSFASQSERGLKLLLLAIR
jgi:hypothetical protein